MESVASCNHIMVHGSSFARPFERGASFRVIQTFPSLLCVGQRTLDKKLRTDATGCVAPRPISEKNDIVIIAFTAAFRIRATCASVQAIFLSTG